MPGHNIKHVYVTRKEKYNYLTIKENNNNLFFAVLISPCSVIAFNFPGIWFQLQRGL